MECNTTDSRREADSRAIAQCVVATQGTPHEKTLRDFLAIVIGYIDQSNEEQPVPDLSEVFWFMEGLDVQKTE